MVNARIPAEASDGLYVVEDMLLFLVPWVVVWALIMRLAMFWPSELFGRRKQVLIILPPSLLQCASLACYGFVLRAVHRCDGEALKGFQMWNQSATVILSQRAPTERLK